MLKSPSYRSSARTGTLIPNGGRLNANFGNATELLLHPDHYVFRMLYSQGVALEDLGIGNPAADPRESWRQFAARYHLFRGTPVTHVA